MAAEAQGDDPADDGRERDKEHPADSPEPALREEGVTQAADEGPRAEHPHLRGSPETRVRAESGPGGWLRWHGSLDPDRRRGHCPLCSRIQVFSSHARQAITVMRPKALALMRGQGHACRQRDGTARSG